MFHIDINRKIYSDFPVIVSNYKELLFDDEPILFSGTNKLGNCVIGSLVDEDYENNFHRYFHVIVDTSTYYSFINQKISYRDILNQAGSIYVIDKFYNDSIKDVFILNFNEIPVDYLPLENTFCPVIENEYSLNFIVSLKGKLADLMKAIPHQVSKIQTSVEEFFDSTLKTLEGFKIKGLITQEIYQAGSFKLTFNINLSDDELFPQKDIIARFINNYTEYCIRNLPFEADLLLNNDLNDLTDFKKLQDNFEKCYTLSGHKIPKDTDKFIINKLSKSFDYFKDISNEVGDNFSSVEFYNKTLNNIENPIAFIDTGYKEKISSAVGKINTKSIDSIEDDDFRDYKICIYHLNIDSRRGNALIYNLGSDDEMSKPLIDISGDEPLEETKFSESLYKNKWIDVKAKAKITGSKFKHLEILYENHFL